MHITKDFVKFVPMKDATTPDELFCLVRDLDRVGVDWTQAVSLAIDGAPQMLGGSAGIAANFKEKLLLNKTISFAISLVFHTKKRCVVKH